MSETNAWVDALRGTPQMKDVPAEGVDKLAGMGVCEACPKGTVLFREGERARALHFLAAGSVEVRRSIGSIEVRVGEVRAPFWLGESGLLEASNRTFTARVSDDATIVTFPSDPLLAASLSSPPLEAALSGLVGTRLRGRMKGVRIAAEAAGAPGLPIFLSVLGARAESGATPRERLRAVLDGTEAIVRFFRGLIVAHTLRDRRGEAMEEKIAALLERASLSDLLALVVEGARLHAPRAQAFFMPELCAFFTAEGTGAENQKMLESLVGVHRAGGPASEDDAAGTLESVAPTFRKLLAGLTFLAEYPLFEFTGMEYRRGKFLYRAERWMGSGAPLHAEVVEFVAPLEVSRMYVTRRNAERLLGLFPWLLRISCAECGGPHLFFATDVEGGLVGYVDPLTGHRLRLPEVKEEFDFISTQFRGKQALRKPRPAAPRPPREGERPPVGAPPVPRVERPAPRPAPAALAAPPPTLLKASVEELVAQTKAAEATMREQAITLLARTGDERAKQPLLDALADTFPGVRRAAAEGIGFAKVSGTADALLPLLKDTVPYVRRMAAWAIAEVGLTDASQAAAEALVASLTDPTLVQFTEKALVKLGGPGSKRGIVTWYDAARGYGFANVEGKHVFIPAGSLEAGFAPKQGDPFTCYVVEEPKGARARLVRKFVQSTADLEALGRLATVKWYDPARGFGFLKTDQGEDVFAHVSELSGDTITTGLRVGQRVKFLLQAGQKGLRAQKIEVVSGGAPPPPAPAPAEAPAEPAPPVQIEAAPGPTDHPAGPPGAAEAPVPASADPSPPTPEPADASPVQPPAPTT